jgi:RNA polymerase sigma-70 factor (ECF subfamily)
MASQRSSWDTVGSSRMPRKSPREVRLTQLVNRHIGFVERVLRNLGVPEADVDDAVQRTFIVVANRLDDIIPAAEKSFLFRSAKHVASHVRRSLARRRLEPIDDHVLSHDLSPELAVSQKRARELLDQILARLPDDLRFVFTLFEFEDLTVPEIAGMLEIPVGTAASRLRRAREHFKVELRRMEALSQRPVPAASQPMTQVPSRVSTPPFGRKVGS